MAFPSRTSETGTGEGLTQPLPLNSSKKAKNLKLAAVQEIDSIEGDLFQLASALCRKLHQTKAAIESRRGVQGKMSPRLHEIRTEKHSQPTPAPILQTRKGQYPNLPTTLSTHSIPPNTTPLLHIPIPDWHTLNSNKKLTTSDLLPSLSPLPNEQPSSKFEQYTGNPGITFLALRTPSTVDFVTNTPGKGLTVTANLPSANITISPEDIVTLHKVLQTDFMTTPSDHPPLHISPTSSKLEKRMKRCAALQSATGNPSGMIVSIGGGDSVEHRRRSACEAPVGVGYSIDGLYAGETPTRRFECIKAVVQALPSGGFRVLSGGSGAPWEVLCAVREGIDCVESSYPFELAGDGYASNILGGSTLNLRDRKWLTVSDVISKECGCLVCRQGFSRAYLRHLFEVHEIMAVSFVTMHNVWDYHVWFERLREAVKNDRFEDFVTEFEKAQLRIREGR